MKLLRTLIASAGLAACLAGCNHCYEFVDFEGYLDGEKVKFGRYGLGDQGLLSVTKEDLTTLTYYGTNTKEGGEVNSLTLAKPKSACKDSKDSEKLETITYSRNEFNSRLDQEYRDYIKKIREYRKNQMGKYIGGGK
jgi:hypothetical protein